MKIQVAIPALVVSLGSLASADVIDPALEAVLRTTPPDSTVSTLVYLAEQTDLAGLTGALDDQRVHRRGRHEAVVRALQDLAADRQAPIVAALDDLVRAGGVQSYQPLWVTNSLRVDGRPGAIVALAQRPDVQRIFFNHPIEGVRPVSEGDGGDQGGGAAGADPEPGLVAIRAPEVWNDLGITGAGVLVSTLDTGVDGGHPALASRWRGLDPAYKDNPGWAFFDPVTGWTFPQDSGSHGTHTMGTVCGGAPGDPVGVAPGAEWIHAAVIDRVNVETTVADAQLAFQWVIDPDGDPGTVFDVPVVNSNSWGLADFHGYPDCDELFWSFLDAAEAAGVLIVFAAGNESFSGLRRPADRATDEYRTLAVAALNGNVPGFPIAGFSSRGPTFCTPDGSAAIKPDIAAPGDDVRSAFPGGGYNDSSGTSMAAPHICGVVALMREANPDATVQEIKQIIYDHAMDLGAPGDDNDFGHGIVDALEAVQAAIDLIQVTFSFPGGLPDLVDPDGGASLLVNIEPGQSAPDPKTAMLHVSTGGDFAAIPMLETEPGVYAAVFPEFECGDQVQFYFSVETMDGDLALNPSGAPEQVYTAGAYTFIGPVFADDFETDTGWSVEDDDTITDGAWDRGVPAGGGDRGDPPTDGDGSGQCYLTDNEDGNSDVDGGTTILTSPVMDASFGDPVIAYRRWYSNVEGNATHQDVMIVEVSDDAGASWVELETVGPDGEEVAGGWFDASFPVAGAVALTDEFRVRFVVGDAEPESIIEAAVDGVQLIRGFCENDRCPADVDGSGEVDVDDLVLVILSWGPCPGCPADVNDDGEVDVADLVDVVLGWGGCE